MPDDKVGVEYYRATLLLPIGIVASIVFGRDNHGNVANEADDFGLALFPHFNPLLDQLYASKTKGIVLSNVEVITGHAVSAHDVCGDSSS